LISSALLEVELDRVASREGIDRSIIDDALDGIYLAMVDQPVLDRAAGLQFHIKTLDAIHLATAAVLNEEMPGLQVLSCDRRVLDGAAHLGLGCVGSV